MTQISKRNTKLCWHSFGNKPDPARSTGTPEFTSLNKVWNFFNVEQCRSAQNLISITTTWYSNKVLESPNKSREITGGTSWAIWATYYLSSKCPHHSTSLRVSKDLANSVINRTDHSTHNILMLKAASTLSHIYISHQPAIFSYRCPLTLHNHERTER